MGGGVTIKRKRVKWVEILSRVVGILHRLEGRDRIIIFNQVLVSG